MKLYVAVVFTEESSTVENFNLSRRTDGDWSCFVDVDKDKAIQRALKAKRRWDGTSSKKCEYKVLVGTLTAEAKIPVMYELTPISK